MYVLPHVDKIYLWPNLREWTTNPFKILRKPIIEKNKWNMFNQGRSHSQRMKIVDIIYGDNFNINGES